VYVFEVRAFLSIDSTGAAAIVLGGTATLSAVAGTGAFYDENTQGVVVPTGTFTALSGSNKNFGAVTDAGLTTVVYIGTVSVSVDGTLDVQFKQRFASGTPSSVLVGSTISIQDIT
jgi:hypothetical protein